MRLRANIPGLELMCFNKTDISHINETNKNDRVSFRITFILNIST